jgi:hypothetical protein
MKVLPIRDLKVALSEIENTDNIMKSTFGLIPYGSRHKAYDLLNTYLSADLNKLLNLKNAQIKAQTDIEAASSLITINKTLSTVLSGIESQVTFNTELQLFRLFRSTAKTSCNSSKEIHRYPLSN